MDESRELLDEQESRRADRLIELATALRYNRRQILKRAAAFGLSAPAIAAVLAACGGDDDDDDDEAPTATEEAGGQEDEPTPTEEMEEEPTEPADQEEDEATEPADEEEEPTATEEEDEEEAEATPTEAASVEGGGIINVSTTLGDAGIGNPILNSNEQWTEYLTFSRLFYFDDFGQIQPDLAESWEFSEDNLTLTITLAEANWHDGTPFTSGDVIFTFDTIADENTDTDHRGRLRVGDEFVTWEAPDDRTVTITMIEPYAPITFALSLIPIIPRHILEGQDINTSDFNLAPIGTGPFRLVEWERDQFVRFERNEDWFRGPVLAEGFTVFFVEDANAGIIALESGDLDMIFTPPEAQERFQDHEQFTLHNYVYYTSITLAFNHNHPVMQDVNFRKAIEMGIDKQSWTDSVTRGRSPVTHHQFADGGPLDRYNDYDNVVAPTYDPEGAAQALEDLGYTEGDDGVRTNGTDRLSFNVITYAGFDEYQNGMVIFQDQMRQIGVEITPNVVEYTTLEEMWADPNDDPANRAFELEEWPHPFEFDPDLFNELHSSNHPPQGNYMWYANDEVDDLIVRGRSETDPDARAAIYQELDVVRSQDLPCIPLYLAVDGWVAANTVLGADGQPVSSPYFRQYRLIATHTFWKEQ